VIVRELVQVLRLQGENVVRVTKVLIVVDYLLHFGCSACIDEFADQTALLQQYEDYAGKQLGEDKELGKLPSQ